MENEKKEISDVFAYNIAKIELEPGVNFTEKYIIKTNISYSELDLSWRGEVDVYIPIREARREYEDIVGLMDESFYVSFAGEKYRISDSSQDSDNKYFDSSRYVCWHFSSDFKTFDKAKSAVEDLKNQFIVKLNNLYKKHPEEVIVQPVEKMIDDYKVYGYATLTKAKNNNLVIRKYLLPAEKKGKDGSFSLVDPFYLSRNSLPNLIKKDSGTWKLSNDNVYIVIEVAKEVDNSIDSRTLQKYYTNQVNEDLEFIKEKYNIAKQNANMENYTSDNFVVKVDNKTTYSINVDRALLYRPTFDDWHIETTMYIPEAIVKELHINENTFLKRLNLETDASMRTDKNAIVANGDEVLPFHFYIYGGKDPNKVEQSYQKVTQRIINFIKVNLLEQNKESER